LLLPPVEVDVDRLRSAVEDQYGAVAAPLRFVPLGEDSWAFRLGPLWLSLRRDLRGHVPGAYAAAHLLARSGLDFVLAPLAGADGRLVRQVEGRPLVVFPYRDISQLSAGGVSAEEARAVVAMLTTVHRADVPADLPREGFSLPFEADLDEAQSFADGPEPAAGYPRRLHRLLGGHRDTLKALRAKAAELGERCRASASGFVLTHGEPSDANVLRGPAGLILADWGGAMWGPPERDWFHVVRTLGIEVPACRDAELDFYRVRWRLSEIAEYATRFRRPCDEDAEDAAMWGRLLRYLPER
jgi:spectinomycin phosphotransferase